MNAIIGLNLVILAGLVGFSPTQGFGPVWAIRLSASQTQALLRCHIRGGFREGKANGLMGHILDRSDNHGMARLHLLRLRVTLLQLHDHLVPLRPQHRSPVFGLGHQIMYAAHQKQNANVALVVVANIA